MIRINNKEYNWEEELTLETVLKDCKYGYVNLALEKSHAIVFVNDEVVRFKDYSHTRICDQDVIQIVPLIGGG